MTGSARVSLLRWLRRQLRQPEPLRERLEAAVRSDDVAEARRTVARFEFSPTQRLHVTRLLDEWQLEVEAGLAASPDDLDPPAAT